MKMKNRDFSSSCIPLLLAVRGNEIYAQDDEGAFLYNFNNMNYSAEQYKIFMRKRVDKPVIILKKPLMLWSIFTALMIWKMG